MWLEARLTKNEILKLYLDRAYMGGGAFGVDAAAQYYFNKSARDVNLAEAAMLAGLFKAPTKFAPHVNLPAARARANVVLDNLVEAGFMTEGQVFGARRHPATPVDRRDERAPNYYLDWAFDEMKKLVDTFPKSMTERVFVVRTALDTNLQKAADLAIENSLRQYGQEYHARQAASVLMEVDGAVRAMVGGRDYGASQFNRATDAMRQPGSSFKPYVYATALEHGFKPSSIVVDAPICLGNWCPHNYGHGYAGSMTLISALTHSINTIAVRLSVAIGDGNPKLGRARIIKTAHDMGIRTPLPDTPSLPIGADAVTLLDHTGAYATFPNLGMKMTPHAVLEVRTGDGKLIWRFDRDGPKPPRALPDRVAADMIKMMNSVVENGTGRRARLDGITAAGKTGTTNAYRDAWFMGYTGNFVCGVWFGNDDYASTNRMTGGALPAMTWHTIMDYAHQGIELKQLPGVPVPPARQQPVVAEAKSKSGEPPPPPRPTVLTKRGADILVRVERMMDDANRALGPVRPTVSTEKKKQAAAPQKGDALAAGDRGSGIRRPELISRYAAASVVSLDANQRLPTTSGSIVRLLLGSLFALAVAAVVGLGATYLALTRGAAFGALSIGSWTAWPKTGTVDADPYARATIARTGQLPIALGDGVSFTAQADDNGKLLDGRCDVVLSGVTPAARFWTLTLYNVRW